MDAITHFLEQLPIVDIERVLLAVGILVAFALLLVGSRRALIRFDFICNLLIGLALYFLTDVNLKSDGDYGEPDLMHVILAKGLGASFFYRAVISFRSRHSYAVLIQNAIFLTRALANMSLVSLIVISKPSVFKDFSFFTGPADVKLIHLASTLLLVSVLGQLVALIRTPHLTQVACNVRSRVNLHVMLDSLPLFLSSSILVLAHTEWHLSLTGAAPDHFHLSMHKALGSLILAAVLFGFFSLILEGRYEKRSHLMGRLVMMLCDVVALTRVHLEHDYPAADIYQGIMIVETVFAANAIAGLLG